MSSSITLPQTAEDIVPQARERAGPSSVPGVLNGGHLRAAPDELVDAGVLQPRRRDGIEYPIWSAVHGLAVLAGPGPLRDVPDAARQHLEELTLAFIDEGLART